MKEGDPLYTIANLGGASGWSWRSTSRSCSGCGLARRSRSRWKASPTSPDGNRVSHRTGAHLRVATVPRPRDCREPGFAAQTGDVRLGCCAFLSCLAGRRRRGWKASMSARCILTKFQSARPLQSVRHALGAGFGRRPGPLPDLAGDPEKSKVLAVPAEAVLTTGLRPTGLRRAAPGRYQLREPKLGPRAGDYYPAERAGRRRPGGHAWQFPTRLAISAHRPNESSGCGRRRGRFQQPEAAAGLRPRSANLDMLSPEDRGLAASQRVCPLPEKTRPDGQTLQMELSGRVIFLCCQGCEEQVKADPAARLENSG